MSDRVLITGASAGIGEATAYAFARQHCRLLLVARRADRLEAITEKCLRLGSPHTHYLERDLSQPGTGGRLIEVCLELLGGLQILICNAGYGIFAPTREVTPEQMQRIWQVNFQSAYESIYAVLPHFLENESGHIVLVSSIVGKKGMPYSAAYCATKFAQIGLGEALWGELKPKGISVTVICPGYTATEFQQVATIDGGLARLDRPVAGQSPQVVARAILAAVRRGRREVHLTWPGKLLLLINRLSEGVATRILAWVARREREPGRVE